MMPDGHDERMGIRGRIVQVFLKGRPVEVVRSVNLDRIDWPCSFASDERFDLAWWDAGTRKHLSVDEEARVADALKGDEARIAPPVPAYVRTEFWRRIKFQEWGRAFLHQDPEVQKAGTVRGVFYLNWSPIIQHMKRTGFMAEALSLLLECVPAGERASEVAGWTVPAAGPAWYENVCIVLRKLGEPSLEVEFIDDVLDRFGGGAYWASLEKRRMTALRLAGKHQAEAA